ncbi:RNA polymerase I associated factor, A49-like protein [Schizophyllum amplum]|uniref:RNA polymerase I associated factor, A49-like protein n=1 Tax=Schizophyllum amplum TaxID=97359 RepID=A0A550CER4_9AGAR|nr:RNA polymerase I associated factor, A49-like protein [Auriculariopsis ampla]
MSSAMHTKKRKRADSATNAMKITLARDVAEAPEVGPTLACFPSLIPNGTTSFKSYKLKKPKTGKGAAEDGLFVAGETDKVEFTTNMEETQQASEAGCKYLVAIHNPRTSSLTVYPATLDPQVLSHTVKALKSIPPAPAPTARAWREARNNLGETFGTKKAKAAIRAQERNKVDVGAMEGVMDHVMQGIDKGAENLLTKEEAKEAADANRLVPAYNDTTDDPMDVYPLHSMIPESEWKALSVSAFEQASSFEERRALLPSWRSEWIRGHLRRVFDDKDVSSKTRKRALKMIFYISAMMAFRRLLSGRGLEKKDLHEKMPGVPSAVVDGLAARFTESSREQAQAPRLQATSTMQTKLLTYMFALCLRVDNCATDSALLAADLQMGQAQVNALFKTMGCKIGKMTERDRARLGVADDTKRAMLTAPVVFPKLKTRVAGRG